MAGTAVSQPVGSGKNTSYTGVQGSGPRQKKQTGDNYDGNSEENSQEKKDSAGRTKLRSWLHSLMSVVLSDGRTLVGTFVCTDRDANIILSSCTEHLPHTHTDGEEEARMLGLAMVPGRHVVSMSVDERTINQRHHQQQLHQHQEEEETTPQQQDDEECTSLDPPLGYT